MRRSPGPCESVVLSDCGFDVPPNDEVHCAMFAEPFAPRVNRKDTDDGLRAADWPVDTLESAPN